MTRELSDVIADAHEQAAILEKNDGSFSIANVRQLLADVRESAEPWLTWLSEGDASVRCGYTEGWLRGRFEAMRRDGNARMNGRSRQYRECAVPRRANTITAAARGRDAAKSVRKAS